MQAIIASILSVLPTIALRLIMPLISEKMVEAVAKKALSAAMKKVALMTETKADDELVEMILEAWGEKAPQSENQERV